MSIRIGLYDFFAYTIPGVFYILIIGFWLNAFQVITLDINVVNNLSLFSLLTIAGAGYIIGLLIDPLAYRWLRLFRNRNREVAKLSFENFRNQHPWLDVRINAADWAILLFTIKHKSIEVAMDIEQHNAASIMLRNLSLGFVLFSLGCLAFFIGYSSNIWNLVFAFLSLVLSAIALTRSNLRREWFYTAIFEAFSAHYLVEGKLTDDNLWGIRKAQKTEPHELNTPSLVPESTTDSMTEESPNK